MTSFKKYQLALHLAKGVGDTCIRQLVSYCGSPEEVFKSSTGHLLKIPGVGQKTVQGIKETSLLDQAEQELERLDKSQVSFSFYTDSAFPQRLKMIKDAPVLLFCKGEAALNFRRSVAIVGGRKATTYGRDVTEKIVRQLKPYAPVIISGLAYGIDIAAHRAALKHSLKTVAVVASGLDIIYPAAHKSTAKEILSHGALLSENKLGTKPDAHFFPARNRIIAGLADVVIVVEAAEKGGALITANIANSYHKDVLAVPGDLGNESSIGCNKLIRDNQAHIYTDIRDIEMLTNWDQDNLEKSIETLTPPSDLTPEEAKVYQLLLNTRDGVLFDDIAWNCQVQVNQLASLLLGMEFRGLINTLPGKRYKLKHGF